jgi:hypothetical protein
MGLDGRGQPLRLTGRRIDPQASFPPHAGHGMRRHVPFLGCHVKLNPHPGLPSVLILWRNLSEYRR